MMTHLYELFISKKTVKEFFTELKNGRKKKAYQHTNFQNYIKKCSKLMGVELVSHMWSLTMNYFAFILIHRLRF